MAFSASDVPVTTAQLGYDAGNTFIQLDRVSVDIDNARHAVAIFTSDGATQGQSNPIDVSVLNGQTAATWSGTQDFSEICDDSEGVQGPSLSASGSRGVTIAWGCTGTLDTPFATGLLWTRSFR